jgi:WD40 repeat protein
MKNHLKRAIGRLTAVTGEGRKVRGTGFLVSDRHVLTAFHVVGSREASRQSKEIVTYATLAIELDGIAELITMSLVPGCADPVADWALLQLDTPVTDREPLVLGTPSTASQDAANLNFETWGFPSLGALAQSGILLEGKIQDENAVYQHAWVYQLFSEHAVANETLDGLSGAPCLINDVATGIIRANLVSPSNETVKKTITLGILYACPIADTNLQERCADHIAVADAVFGDRDIYAAELPPEPFRYLHWYDRQHRGVYFGRDAKIQALRCRVTSPDLPMVTLVYGASGVGKSSLLEAGLAPRMSKYAVALQRRETGRTLLDTFEDMFASCLATAGSRPAAILLDQIEEVYTEPKSNGNAEIVQLAQRLAALQDMADVKLKVVLGFRSEWLAPIRERLSESGVRVSDFFLEPMKTAEIAQVVRGIAGPRHFERYQVKVEPELAARIATDLTKDPHSPISPVLSIILTKLWKLALEQPRLPRTLLLKDYDDLMRGKVNLSTFLCEQIEKVRQIRPADVNSGLVHDLLYRHTTEFGATKLLSYDVKQSIYSHFRHEEQGQYISNLTDILCKHSLLYSQLQILEPGDAERAHHTGTRLIHDTLAIVVRDEYYRSALPGQRACRLLESKASTFVSADLQIIEKGLRGMRVLDDEERTLLARAKHQATMTQRNHRAAVGSACLAVLAITASAIWALNEGGTQLSKRLLSEGERLVQFKQPELGIPLALLGHAIAPSDSSYGTLINIALAIHDDIRYYGHSWTNKSLSLPAPAAFSRLGGAAVVNAYHSAKVINLTPGAGDSAVPMPELDESTVLATSADGNCIAAAFNDTRLILRPLPGRTCASQDIPRPSAEAKALSIAISRNNQSIAVGTDHGTLEIHSADGWTQLSLPSPYLPTDRIIHLTFADADNIIVAGTATGAVWLADNKQASKPRTLLSHIDDPKQQRVVNAIAVDPTEKIFYVARDDNQGVRRYDFDDLDHPVPIPTADSPRIGSIASLAVSPDSRTLAIGTWAGPIHLWDTRTLRLYKNYEGHKYGAMFLAFSDNNYLISWPYKGTGHAWDTQQQVTINATDFPIFRAALTGQNDELEIGGKEGQVRRWRKTSGRWIEVDSATPGSHHARAALVQNPIQPIPVDFSGKDTKSTQRKPLSKFCPPPLLKSAYRGSNTYTNIVFDTKCENMAAIDGVTKELVLFRNNRQFHEVARLDPAAYRPNSFLYTPDGRWLVASSDNSLSIFNSQTGKPIGPPLTRRADMITGLFLDPGGKTIYSYGEPGIDLWPTPEGAYQQLCSISLPAISEKQRTTLFESVLERQLMAFSRQLGNLIGREEWKCKALQQAIFKDS